MGIYLKTGNEGATSFGPPTGDVMIKTITLAALVADSTVTIQDSSSGSLAKALVICAAAKSTTVWPGITGGNQFGFRRFIAPLKILVAGDASTETAVEWA